MATPLLSSPLTILKGIGPAKQRRLKQALGVTTVEGLLSYSATEIYEGLAALGPAVPRREIERWLEQARAQQPAAPLAEEITAPEVAEPPEAPPAVEPAADPKISPASEESTGAPADLATPGKIPLHLYRQPSDSSDHLWVERGDRCQRFTLRQASDLYRWLSDGLAPVPVAEPSLPQNTLATADTAELPLTRIDIMTVGVTPLGSNGPGPLVETVPHFLPKDQPFIISVRFRVIPHGEGDGWRSLVALAQFNVRNRLNGDTFSLGVAQGKVAEAGVPQLLQCPPARLSEPGIYQLQTVVSLQNVRSLAGYRELQLIQVLA